MNSLVCEKKPHHPTPPQINRLVKRGNQYLGDMLRSMLLEKDKAGTCYCHRSCKVSEQPPPLKQMTESTDILMLSHEFWLTEHLLFEPTVRESYAAELADYIEAAHEKLRMQQLQLRIRDRQKVVPLVWLRTRRF